VKSIAIKYAAPISHGAECSYDWLSEQGSSVKCATNCLGGALHQGTSISVISGTTCWCVCMLLGPGRRLPAFHKDVLNVKLQCGTLTILSI